MLLARGTARFGAPGGQREQPDASQLEHPVQADGPGAQPEIDVVK